MKNHLIMLSLVIASVNIAQSRIELPTFFSDNMVLQRNSETNIWGKGTPLKTISIEADWGNSTSTEVLDDGTWKTRIETPDAGGPYNLTITDGIEKVVMKNVLIGEVWLCSGQSNMEMPLAGWPPNDLIDNSAHEIASANYSDLRLFTVSRARSASPMDDVIGNWEECSPQSAQSFSATAYFFGKKIYDELGIPIGLIHSSWGGTPAEAWTEISYLKDVPGYENFPSSLDEMTANQDKLNDWLESHKSIEIKELGSKTEFVDIDFDDAQCKTLEFDDTDWDDMNLPTKWEQTDVGNFDGVIWFRKTISVPNDWENSDLILELGPIDDMDAVFFNGIKIGAYESVGGWNIDRKYEISGELLQSGSNTIAVRVIDTGGGGGICGQEEQLKIYPVHKSDKAISIAGSWKYLPVAEYVNSKFYLYGVAENTYPTRPGFGISVNSQTPTMLYNAMIAPLVGYNLRGAIWYQGESNVGRTEQYRKLFPAMIQSWRNAWRQGEFPFYFVQIAPYNYADPDSPESAELRESQLAALELKNTGVAVTLDIGMADNIHPANKKDVGERLALWALAKDYGKADLVYSGPIYKSIEIDDGKLVLSFDQIGSGIASKEKYLSGFTIAGKDKKFVEATAVIEKDQVIVTNEKIKEPVAVRYTWKNVPKCSLFNKEGLPAPTFKTDNWSD